ncbi:hypothetical protein [Candidatus Nitrosocosmicus sp. T]
MINIIAIEITAAIRNTHYTPLPYLIAIIPIIGLSITKAIPTGN